MSEKEQGAEPRKVSASEAELVADLKPTGALERMMIQQMARAHDTTMACFDRAESAEAGPAREVELRLAARFMTLFMQQAGALDRRRAQARKAEEATQRLYFDADAARTRAFLAHCEDSLRRSGTSAKAGGHGELDDYDEFEDLDELADPAALRDMAERLGLPNPVGADGRVDPAALEALSQALGERLLGGQGAGAAASGGG